MIPVWLRRNQDYCQHLKGKHSGHALSKIHATPICQSYGAFPERKQLRERKKCFVYLKILIHAQLKLRAKIIAKKFGHLPTSLEKKTAQRGATEIHHSYLK